MQASALSTEMRKKILLALERLHTIDPKDVKQFLYYQVC